MADQKIEVEVNIVNQDETEEKITRILIDLIKLRLSKYPLSSQLVIYNILIGKIKTMLKQ